MIQEPQIRYGYDPKWISQIMAVFNNTDMKRADSDQVGRDFKASFAVASIWQEGNLLGFGRMISDGEMYSTIFDLVVDPEHQRKGFGQQILQALIARAPETLIYLTSTFGNESFYLKNGFLKHRTALALYPASFGTSAYLDPKWKPEV